MKSLFDWLANTEARIGRAVIRFRWPIIFGSVLTIAAVSAGLSGLSMSSGYRPLFEPDDARLLAFDAMEDEFTAVNNVLFIVEPGDGNVFTPRTLGVIVELTDRAWTMPYSQRVDSVTNFQHTTAIEDDLYVGDLVNNTTNLSADELQRTRSIALSEPALRRQLISEAGHVAGVNVNFQLPGRGGTSELPEAEISNVANAIADEFRQRYPDVSIHVTGRLLVDYAFYKVAQDDGITLVPLSFLLMMVLLLLLSRSAIAAILTTLVIAGSIIFSLGILGYFGVVLHTGNAAGPTIILTIASASCVHLLMTYLHQVREHGRQADSIVESLRVNFQPITLTCVSTSIGFLSILLSDIPAFRVLSVMVTLGIFASWVMVIFLMPALLSLLPDRDAAGPIIQNEQRASDLMQRLGEFVVGNSRPLFFASVFVIVGALACIPRNELNDNFIGYFDESLPFRRAADFAIENLGGVYTIQYALDSLSTNGINEPEFLAEVEGFSNWLLTQPEVLHVNSIGDTYKRINKSMHGDDQAYYRLPDNREEAAQYLLLYELSLPYGLDLNNQVNLDKSKTRLVVSLISLTSRQFIALDERVKRWTAENTRYSEGLRAEGPTMLFSYKSSSNAKNMLLTTSVALIGISGLLIIMLRSLKIGFVSLVPNLAPAAIGFGIWGIINGEISLANSLVMSMTLGIVVDDTVHFLSKYQRARREKNMDAANAIIYSFKTVGQALIITSAMLAGGFFVLAQSPFQINGDMGLLTGMIIMAALLADFYFLPPLLMKIDR